MGGKATQLIAWTLLVWLAGHNVAEAKSEQDIQGAQKLAAKLRRLGQSLEMKEARYNDSKGGGGKDYDANTGNSFTSNTTYHSYVWDVCEDWIGPGRCARWLDAYASPHGRDADRSPLEGAMYEMYLAKRPNKQPQGNQWGLWQVQAREGAQLVDAEGKLNREQLVEFKLLPEPVQKAREIGRDTAQREINKTYEQGDNDGITMPNMESLRMMASRWTRMFRNRMVSNLGELRVADRPIEFGLGEDKADCDQYLAALRTELDRFRTEDRLDTQAKQQIETRTAGLEQRYNMCQQMRAQSVYKVNPKVDGNEIVEAGAGGEQVDKWRSRIQIAAIDFVGMDLNSLPRPGDQQLTEEELKSTYTEYAAGGAPIGEVRKSNAESLQGYNQALQESAIGYRQVVAKSGGMIRDLSGEVMKYQIQPGTVNAVRLNSLTGEMREELGQSDLEVVRDTPDSPENNLEQRPIDVTVSKR